MTIDRRPGGHSLENHDAFAGARTRRLAREPVARFQCDNDH